VDRPEPSEIEAAAMSDTCRRLQDEMLIFGRGGLPKVGQYDGTLKSLMNCYQTDPDSTYHKKRYAVPQKPRQHLSPDGRAPRARGDRRHQRPAAAGLASRMDATAARRSRWATPSSGICGRCSGSAPPSLKIPSASGFAAFCTRCASKAPKPRTERLTAEQAVAVRKVAREHFGWPSIALAQALQFDLMLRQKDVIGEWVPRRGAGHQRRESTGALESTDKWLRGLRWSEVNENLILKHNTSKRGKDLRSI
jgi:hypothetical protein